MTATSFTTQLEAITGIVVAIEARQDHGLPEAFFETQPEFDNECNVIGYRVRMLCVNRFTLGYL